MTGKAWERRSRIPSPCIGSPDTMTNSPDRSRMFLLLVLLTATSIPAQTHEVLPSGTRNMEGNAANSIPWWSFSGTYQQVHDDQEMMALSSSGPITITGIGFRRDGYFNFPFHARTVDIQLTLGITGLDSRTSTQDFAMNLGPNPTIVMPYTQVNIPALVPVSVPNPLGFMLQFSQPFVFQALPGNHFCWEMRHTNSSDYREAPLDAQESNAVVAEMVGLGCVVSGRNLPAAITTLSWNLTTGVYRNILTRATPNTPATFFLGVQPASLTLPTLCSTLELVPSFSIAGSTTATGAWDLTFQTNRRFVGIPQTTLYGQFVFLDGTLPLGLGLSDASRLASPIPAFSSRFYTAPRNGGFGYELSTTAEGSTRDFGLVTFLQTR